MNKRITATADLTAKLGELLASAAASATGSATRVTRLLLLEEPPSLDAGEVTDKGSLNQRAILERRNALVEGMYQGRGQSLVTVPAR